MELRMIPLEEIQPNPLQPRESFRRESLQELADSIRESGIIQPIVVRRHGKGYQIIAGERRWRAAQIASIKEIPSIIKDTSDERILLESLVENLHRLDLTDFERENTVHELWEKGEKLGFKNKADLAKTLGVREERVLNDIDAWEVRHEEKVPSTVSTDVIRRTKGLEPEIRKRIIERVEAEEIKASEVDTVAKVMRKASKPVKQELLKSKSLVTPRMAEAIVERLPNDEDQDVVLKEIKKFRLTEDEVRDRVREIQRAKEVDQSLVKEMGVQEGVVYTVGEYECPHCKRHYLIKCDGKRDWVE